MKNNQVFKHYATLIIIVFALFVGVVFAYFLDRGDIDAYFQANNYQPQFVKIRPAKLVKIGFTTDVHARYSNSAQSINKESKQAMQVFAAEMQKFSPDFIIDGGDFIEGTKRTEKQAIFDFQEIQKIQTSDGNVPYYYVLGNHELRGLSRNKWLELTGLEKAYYSFDVDNLRVIVLDGNYQPSSSQGDIPIEPGLTYTRGYVSREQMVWLENLLQQSREFRKIVFLHQPPLDNTNHKSSRYGFPAGAGDLRALFSKYGVMAVFSGHIEEAYHENIAGVDYFITPGFLKDNDQDEGQDYYKKVYSEIEVSRKVRLKMHYKNQEPGNYEYLWL